MMRGPTYAIPPALRTPDHGLQCPTCGRVLHDSDDKSTGWASRAYYAHFVNEHNPPDLTAGVDFWSGARAIPPEPFVSWQQVMDLAREHLDCLKMTMVELCECEACVEDAEIPPMDPHPSGCDCRHCMREMAVDACWMDAHECEDSATYGLNEWRPHDRR